MKSTVLLLLLCLAGQAGLAAPLPPANARVADSLQRRLRTAPADTARVNLLLRLSSTYQQADTARAAAAALEGLRLAGQLRDVRARARATRQLASVRYVAGAFRRALPLFAAAAALARQGGDAALESNACRGQSMSLEKLGQLPEAMALALRALKLAEAGPDSLVLADAIGQVGHVNLVQKHYPPAEQAYLRAEQIYRRLRIPDRLGRVNNLLGIVARDAGRHPQAAAYFRQGMAVYRQAGDSAGVAGTLVSIGVLLQRQGTEEGWPQSLAPLLRAERIYKYLNSQNYGVMTDLYSILGGAYANSDSIAKGTYYMRRSLQMARASHDMQEVCDALESMAVLLFADGKYKEAALFEHQHSLVSDTIRSAAAASQLADMQARYETEKKEAQNRIQGLQLRQQALQLHKRDLQLAGGGALALLLLALAYLLYNRRRLRREVEFAQERQRLERLRASAVLEAEEAERRRIGSDLHDGVGQLLSVAKMNLHSLGEELNIETQGQQALLQNALDVVDESFREVRSISHNLMPNALIKRGLALAVRDFLGKISPDDRLKVQLEVVGLDRGGRLDPTVENVLFRVIQELVQNIIKHAKASQITLQILRSEEELTVMVEDNGVGFDPAALGEEAGIGLKNIESRMAYLGGRAAFDSQPGRGTTVTLELPLAAVAA